VTEATRDPLDDRPVPRGTTCPQCGSGDVAQLIWGLPGPELMEKADQGEVVLGGCVVPEQVPHLTCRSCDATWDY
jgi:hypothetical protein